MGGWGCPHEFAGKCQKIENRPCDPGMKGCVLAGRFIFSNAEKNRPSGVKRRSSSGARLEESREQDHRSSTEVE
ncbi:MAG: hypothetical protein HQL49_01025 [Gammaproteobacteria bacterium]|nr:hypothetical protein [Gammaproteobacteria bacterium]